MATESQWNALPGVETQTELDAPIKVRWTGDARTRVRSGLHAALEDDWHERAIAIRCFDRQKTNIVVKTHEELEALRDELESHNYPGAWDLRVGYTANGHNAIVRVLDELPEKSPTIEPGATVETHEWGEVTVESESNDGVYEKVRIDAGGEKMIVHKDTLEEKLL